jgi:hypothetical protein
MPASGIEHIPASTHAEWLSAVLTSARGVGNPCEMRVAIAPWLAAAVIGCAVALSPAASADASLTPDPRTKVVHTAPAPSARPQTHYGRSGEDPLVPNTPGADPYVPAYPGMDRPF